MKRRFYYLMFLLSFSWFCQVATAGVVMREGPPSPVHDKWALVVGISEFQNHMIDLKYAAKDAQDFYNFLITDGHFAPDHVKLLLNERASRESIMSELGDSWLPRQALPDDLVVIYIASHGSPSRADMVGVNYLVAHNTDINHLYATAIPMQTLANVIKERVKCRRVVLILDACHSGAAESGGRAAGQQTNFDAASIAQGTGQLVICSSQPDQLSWESRRYQNGVFTHWLIQGFKSQGQNGILKDVLGYTTEKVQQEVAKDQGELQTPVIRSSWHGDDLLLSAVPFKPRPGGLEVLPEHDVGPYLDNLQKRLLNQWKPPAGMSAKGVVVRFLVHRDGKISNVTIQDSCGNKDWDTQAAALVLAASPVDKLPARAPDHLPVKCTFGWQEHAGAGTASGAPAATGKTDDKATDKPADKAADTAGTTETAAAPSGPAGQFSVCVLDLGVAQCGGGSKDKDKKESDARKEAEEKVAVRLTKDAFSELKRSLGNRVLNPVTVAEALVAAGTEEAPDERNAAWWTKVGQATRSKYIVSGSVEEAQVAGSPADGKHIMLAICLKVMSGETGQVVWSMEATSPIHHPVGAPEMNAISLYFKEIVVSQLVSAMEAENF